MKTKTLILITLLLIPITIAGSITDLNYITYYYRYPIRMQTTDNTVTINADTIAGKQVKDLQSSISQETISRWLTGTKELFLKYNNFMDFLKTQFTTKNELEQLQQRIDKLEAQCLTTGNIELNTNIIEDRRINIDIQYKGYTFNQQSCIKVTPK